MNADAELLLGTLAFQLNFVDRLQFLAAFDAWSQQPHQLLGQILVEQRALSSTQLELLEALRREHLKRFNQDVAKSLASLMPMAQSVRQDLEARLDARLHASLAQVGAGRAGDEARTTPPTVGESTSDGLRFRILRAHAKGGLGEVYVAEDEELHREVALKRMQDRYADQPESRARFLQEAEITGGLEHPSVVPVYGLGNYANGRPFYAMRFVRGDSLNDVIRRFHRIGESPRDQGERTLELRKLLQRFINVCNAIEYAHSRGVLHRDLKPSNIMLGKYGETFVVDWGLAKAMGKQQLATPSAERPLVPSGSSDSAPTQMGSAIGTPAYMSPEQAAGRLDELGPATDVYGLGATLYSILCGQEPVSGRDVGEILRRAQSGEFPRPRALNPRLPRALEAICLRAMSLRPADRYPTAMALADDLEHWLADEPVSALPRGVRDQIEQIANTLTRTRLGRNFRGWSVLAFWAASVMLISTILTLYRPVLGTAFFFIFFFLLLLRCFLSPSNEERQLSIVLAFNFVATVLMDLTLHGSASALSGQNVWAHAAIINGMAFVSVGFLCDREFHLYACGFLVFGLVLSLLTPSWSCLAYGLVWSAVLVRLGVRIRQLDLQRINA